MFFKNLFSRFTNKNRFRLQTFSYYIPAPPPRTKGYREKEFDKAFYQFVNRGYEVVSFQTQSHAGEKSSGIWVIFVVRALNEEADKLDLDDHWLEDELTKSSNPPIEGLYHVESK